MSETTTAPEYSIDVPPPVLRAEDILCIRCASRPFDNKKLRICNSCYTSFWKVNDARVKSGKQKLTIDEYISLCPSRKRYPKAVLTTARPTPLPCKSSVRPAIEVIPGFLIQSEEMYDVVEHISAVASHDLTVFIQGETGVGKELVARALHCKSRRANKPFIIVDCGAFNAELLEGELFGHERGAFTTALTARVGLIEAAHNGTLFFDEIGELPLTQQSRLLRVLEERQVRRIGSNAYKDVDIRFILATNKDIRQLVAEGKFREDLHYRLNEFPINVPPLRSRGAESVVLAEHFAEKFCRGTTLSSAVGDYLVACQWPGNVRELRNVVRRAIVNMNDSSELCIRHIEFPREFVARREGDKANPLFLASRQLTLKDIEGFEADYLLAMVERCGNVAAAARMLGMNRTTLTARLRHNGNVAIRSE